LATHYADVVGDDSVERKRELRQEIAHINLIFAQHFTCLHDSTSPNELKTFNVNRISPAHTAKLPAVSVSQHKRGLKFIQEGLQKV
jgi:hypothetical protein